jgi:predicted glycosyltransferase involved in capsule biosynthesis
MKKLSIIVAVLDSHEVVRRQLLHLDRVLSADCELIMIDDGSVPPLCNVWESVKKSFDGVLHATNDRRPWTQPRARNIGARLACADRLLFFDIDHILTANVIDACVSYPGDMLRWIRRPAILDADGRIVTNREQLVAHGMTDDSPSVHMNSFMIRKPLFERLGGYDERFCLRYGGDDVDFHRRYEHLCRMGLARQPEVRGAGYVSPDPATDVMKLFHSLSREPEKSPCRSPK